jgi:membrane-associated protein
LMPTLEPALLALLQAGPGLLPGLPVKLTPELLLLVGPWLLALMAWLETSLPIGLLVPAGVALALGAFLAHEGYLSMPQVILAAGLGGVAGDWTGYWLGRTWKVSVFQWAPGVAGRLARRHEAPTARIIQKRPFWAVSLGRTVSFVRTLMPAAVGRSGMPFGRFVVFDAVGVLGWLALYVGVGILAGASWRVASGLMGTGWALVFILAVTVGVVVGRVRARRSQGEVVGPG